MILRHVCQQPFRQFNRSFMSKAKEYGMILRHVCQQPFRQFNRSFMSKACENGVFQFGSLLCNLLTDIRIAVSMQIDPPGTYCIQVSITILSN